MGKVDPGLPTQTLERPSRGKLLPFHARRADWSGIRPLHSSRALLGAGEVEVRPIPRSTELLHAKISSRCRGILFRKHPSSPAPSNVGEKPRGRAPTRIRAAGRKRHCGMRDSSPIHGVGHGLRIHTDSACSPVGFGGQTLQARTAVSYNPTSNRNLPIHRRSPGVVAGDFRRFLYPRI